MNLLVGQELSILEKEQAAIISSLLTRVVVTLSSSEPEVPMVITVITDVMEIKDGNRGLNNFGQSQSMKKLRFKFGETEYSRTVVLLEDPFKEVFLIPIGHYLMLQNQIGGTRYFRLMFLD